MRWMAPAHGIWVPRAKWGANLERPRTSSTDDNPLAHATLLLEHSMEGGFCVVGCLILHYWKLQNAAVWFPDGNKQSEEQQHGYIEAGHASCVPAGDTTCDGSERGCGEPDQPSTNHHSAPGRSPLGFKQQLPGAQRGNVSAGWLNQ